MIEKLDLRGLLCPEPVIRTKKLFDKKETQHVEAVVDDEICVANLQRLAKSLKASCSVEAAEGFFSVRIDRIQAPSNDGIENLQSAQVHHHIDSRSESSAPDNKRIGTVIFLTSDRLGEGDPDFGNSLLNVFLQTMFEAGHRPRAILMANSAVKIMRKDSPLLKVLDDFRNSGAEVLACGLCVEFYGLKEDISKEQITNMFAICEYLAAAEKVISP